MRYVPIKLPYNNINEDKIYEWSLVLTAIGIDHKINKSTQGLILEVDYLQKKKAICEILEYEKEEEKEEKELRKKDLPTKKTRHSMESSIWILFLIFIFHIISKNSSLSLEQIGAADSWAIYKGEWWRLITCLTLHKNVAHVLSNIFWEGVFIYFLLREIEPSIAWALILLGGILGNLINYFYHPLNHISIGFSTCVFATCGISVGIRSVQNPRDIGIYVMTGLGLFAMLGIGAQIVDVGSHFFGLIIGFILGVVFELFELDKISFKNSLIFFVLFLVVALSWAMAIFFGKNYLEL
ncbi:rhomboid family intramembrane serine protease [Desulfothermus okinawensis JCM 13304]